MLATELAMRRIDGRLEEAAMIVAPPGRVLRRITLPLAAPTILAAALIIFVLAVSEFGVPGLLRVRVYTTEVFTAFAALYDFSRAIVLAVPSSCFVLRSRLQRPSCWAIGSSRRGALSAPRPSSSTPGGGPRDRHHARRGGRGCASLGSSSSRGPRRPFTDCGAAGSGDAIVSSLLLSAAGATLVVALARLAWLCAGAAGSPLRLAAQVLLVALFAVPSTIVGVGLIGLWNRPGPLGALYGTDVMFLLAYLARFVPVAALILAATAQTVSVSQEEAAAVSGAGWFRTIRANRPATDAARYCRRLGGRLRARVRRVGRQYSRCAAWRGDAAHSHLHDHRQRAAVVTSPHSRCCSRW